MKQKTIAIAGISAAMLVGAGTGLALGLPSGAGASGSNAAVTDPTDPATESTDATTDTTDTTDSTTDDTRAGGLQSTLDELVAAGTITQEQADAIVAAIKANLPEGGFRGPGGHGHGGPGGPGGFGGFGGRGGPFLDTAATALGITADELKTELEAGKTIADVAAEKGVDVQTVIDAIVAAQTANIEDRVTDMVNGVRPEKPAGDSSNDSSTDSSESTETTEGS